MNSTEEDDLEPIGPIRGRVIRFPPEGFLGGAEATLELWRGRPQAWWRTQPKKPFLTVRTDAEGFKRRIVSQCGGCHPHDTEAYFETYHGKVTQLGSEGAAKCYDCHGTHNILPSEDPHSTLSQRHVVETCGQCHPRAHLHNLVSRSPLLHLRIPQSLVRHPSPQHPRRRRRR